MNENDRDSRLATLLEDLSAQARAGKIPDVKRVAEAHPELAEELNALWAVAQYANMARGLATSPAPSPALTAPESVNNPLPREYGDFELLSEVGRGGMGVVYQARQKSLGRVVALKMIREAHHASEADKARFRAEAEAAARLTHPNIVGVYEVGEHQGQAFLSLEYVEGQTLAQRLQAEGPLACRDAAALLATMARAVHYAHEQGILHRDLKPSNILLASPDNTVKVTDFGLAKTLDRAVSLTRTGAIVGTPSYMAPEQATNRKAVSPASDVYSLGAVLYEMLTGRPPFQAASQMDTLLKVLEQEPVPPRQLNRDVDRDLELICLKCLQKPADLRYASAKELAEDVEAYLAGDRLSTRPSGLGYFFSRLLRETHHAGILENWGRLWMMHSVFIFILCLLTQFMAWAKMDSHVYYLVVWGAGLLSWGALFWRIRRRAGPVLFVERQIAHAWAAGVIASIGLFIIEVIQGLPVLTLSPVLAVVAGMVFFVTAGTLSGQFYLTSFAFFATAVVMAIVPIIAHLIFGVVSALAFLIPGYKYYLVRKQSEQESQG